MRGRRATEAQAEAEAEMGVHRGGQGEMTAAWPNINPVANDSRVWAPRIRRPHPVTCEFGISLTPGRIGPAPARFAASFPRSTFPLQSARQAALGKTR